MGAVLHEDVPIHGPYVTALVMDAIAGQRLPEDRETLTDAALAGEVEVWGPDERGWRSITVGGNRILVVHWTQLCSRETLEALVGPLPDWQPPKARPA